MDQLKDKRTAVETIDFMIETQAQAEQILIDFRQANAGTLHPWAMPSLANAIGSLQHAIGDLKAVKGYIEKPAEPVVSQQDQSFAI